MTDEEIEKTRWAAQLIASRIKRTGGEWLVYVGGTETIVGCVDLEEAICSSMIAIQEDQERKAMQ